MLGLFSVFRKVSDFFGRIDRVLVGHENYGPIHPAYNPYFLACFFSRNSVFLSE
jgi:hypothetical protein